MEEKKIQQLNLDDMSKVSGGYSRSQLTDEERKRLDKLAAEANESA